MRYFIDSILDYDNSLPTSRGFLDWANMIDFTDKVIEMLSAFCQDRLEHCGNENSRECALIQRIDTDSDSCYEHVVDKLGAWDRRTKTEFELMVLNMFADGDMRNNVRLYDAFTYIFRAFSGSYSYDRKLADASRDSLSYITDIIDDLRELHELCENESIKNDTETGLELVSSELLEILYTQFMNENAERMSTDDRVLISNIMKETIFDRKKIDARYKAVMDKVVTDKDIDWLVDIILDSSISDNECDKNIIMCGVKPVIQLYMAEGAIERITSKLTTLDVCVRNVFPSVTGTISERVDGPDTDDINMIICIIHAEELAKDGVASVMRLIRARYKDAIVLTITGCTEHNPTVMGARLADIHINKESIMNYVELLTEYESYNKKFIVNSECREKLKSIVHDYNKSIDDIENIVKRATLLAVKRNDAYEVSVEDIDAAMELIGNTDAGSGADELSLVRGLEKSLKKVIKGQDTAVEAITRAVKIAKAGLNEPSKPIASLMFVGPTGVGKTETAIQLAAALEREFVRVDMGDYKDKTAVNKFSGASAGYIGYDDGSVLGKSMEGKKHCVVLFDEIEKAHPDIFDVMMHMLDNGEIKDNKGEIIDFHDAIIIMTSNAGAREIDKMALGFGAVSNADKRNERGLSDCVSDEISEIFKPEFINRFDGIVQFNRLTKDVAVEIAERLIDELAARAKHVVTFSDACINRLGELGTDPRFGAREIKRVINNEIKSILADAIIDGQLDDGDIIELDYMNNKFDVNIKKKDKNNSAGKKKAAKIG